MSDTPFDTGYEDTPRNPAGARALAQGLVDGDYPTALVASWLKGGFPGADAPHVWPHEAMVHALRDAAAQGEVSAWPVRRALAAALKEILTAPLAEDAVAAARLLHEVYELSRIIQVRDILAEPLAAAAHRGLPDGVAEVELEFGRVPQYLLTAVMANQVDPALERLWLDLLRHDAQGDAIRERWDAHWGHGWEGIRDMPTALDVALPSLTAIAEALPDAARWIELEVASDEPGLSEDDRERECQTRYLDMIEDLADGWPTLNRRLLAALPFVATVPDWVLGTSVVRAREQGIVSTRVELGQGEREFLKRFRPWFAGRLSEMDFGRTELGITLCQLVCSNIADVLGGVSTFRDHTHAVELIRAIVRATLADAVTCQNRRLIPIAELATYVDVSSVGVPQSPKDSPTNPAYDLEVMFRVQIVEKYLEIATV